MMWIPIMVIILLLLVFAGYFLFKPSDKTQLKMAKTDESATVKSEDNTLQPAAAKNQPDTLKPNAPKTDNHKNSKQIEDMSKKEKPEPPQQYIDTKEDNALADSYEFLR